MPEYAEYTGYLNKIKTDFMQFVTKTINEFVGCPMILVVGTSLISLSSQNLANAEIHSKVNNFVMATRTTNATISLNVTLEECGEVMLEAQERKLVKQNKINAIASKKELKLA